METWTPYIDNFEGDECAFLIVATEIIDGKMHGYIVDGETDDGIIHTTDPKQFDHNAPIRLEMCVIIERNYIKIPRRVK